METVITRKVGNSVTVTIPKELNISTGREYLVYKGADNVIVFAPKIENPLFNSGNVQMTDEFEEVRFLDTELE
jgi:antitoxin component of MazEF toxin-antitoxin module